MSKTKKYKDKIKRASLKGDTRKASKYQKKLDKYLSMKKSKKPQSSTTATTSPPQPISKEGVSLLLFYAYIEPEWSVPEHEEAIEWATKMSAKYNVSGRLRVAREGFNGTMTGPYDGLRALCQAMREWKPEMFGNTQFKLTDNLPDGQLFPGELKVMRVAELVNYGLGKVQPSIKEFGGVHLEPHEYHKKMEEPNTVIIDVRNSYEADIGKFQPPKGGAKYIDPLMRVSTEFPNWVDRNKAELEGKQIMLYCTGGIRCERASALMRQKGLDNVFQMQGGIHRYLEEYNEDGGYWVGKNYTFDKRFAHGAKESEVVGKCVSCKIDWDKYRGKKRCPGCGVPLLICDDCQSKGKEKESVCNLCQIQGKTPRDKVVKTRDFSSTSCGVCEEVFKSRNALFKHINESGHHNRKVYKRRQ